MQPEPQLPPDETREALARVLRSPQFAGAERRKKLLEYLVEQSQRGTGPKELSIGIEVYGRDPATYDPRLDPVVRVDIGRLRAKLEEYYTDGGRGDPIRIQLPKGAYTVFYEAASPAPLPPEAAFEARPAPRPRPHLRWVGLTVVLAAALGAGAYLLYRWNEAHAAFRSVVVLPFENMTGDPQNQYLADGVTEDLTDSLAHIPSLLVVARTSAFQFKGKNVDVREIGRKLGVEALVEGSLRKVNGQLRLTVQVNRTANGYHVLSQTFDGGVEDLARLEGDMVLPVLAVLRPGTAWTKPRAVDPQAHDFYLKARAYRGRGTVEAFEQAIGYLNQAIRIDPQYADAYAGLASVYASGAVNFASQPLQYAANSKAAAAKAIELDPLSATAYAAEGFVDGMVLLDWKRGEDELRNAVRLMPQNSAARNWLGLTLLCQGRFDEALVELKTAYTLDPLPGGGAVTVGLAYYMARRYDESLRQLTSVRDLHPDLAAVHPFLGMAWEGKGEYGKAMSEYQLVLPKIPSVRGNIAHLLAVTGKPVEARKMLEPLEHPGPAGAPVAFDLAAVYAALGDRDTAFQWLDQAYRDRRIAMLKVHPMLDPLRGDPRFAVLLRQAGLAR